MENAQPSWLNPIFPPLAIIHLTLAPRSIFEAKKKPEPTASDHLLAVHHRNGLPVVDTHLQLAA
jgi:hypothetical protein